MSLQGKTVLVTGASRGIGYEVALAFAKEGAHVIAVARSKTNLTKLDDAIRAETGQGATLVPLDLAEFDKIDELGALIAERFGKLDILVGNAAVLGSLMPLAHVKPKMWQQIMDINVTANWRLLRTCDPLLREAGNACAIFVTSGVTEGEPNAYWGPYAISKAALEMMVGTYQTEMADTGVKAHLFDPGRVRTSMRAAAYPGEDPNTLPTADSLAPQFIELAKFSFSENV